VGRASLEGVELKLERAKDHFTALTEQIAAHVRDPETYGMVLEVNQQRRPVLLIERIKKPDPRWAVLIGDCVHNLRSALDHLAFQLMLGNRSGPVPRDLYKSSAFPIMLSGRKWAKRVGKGDRKGQPTNDSGLYKIQGVSAIAADLIESLQPYHRRKNPETRSLWELDELWNADKHRLFPLVHTSFEVLSFQLKGNLPFALLRFESIPGPLKRNTEVARWAYVASDEPVHMHVDAELVTDITFNKGKRTPYPVRGQSVLLTLHRAMRFIAEEVVPPLADDLGCTFNFSPGRLIDTRSLSAEEYAAMGEPPQIPGDVTLRHA
jgi:hypothetical protein